MELTDAIRQFLDDQPIGVVATTRADGSVRQSVVYHVREGDTLLLSTESKRAKARDVQRTGRASYCVMGHAKPFPAVTVEGPARVLTQGIGEPTARLFGRIFGQPPGEALSDEALAEVDRVIIELQVEHVYGVSHFQA